MKNIWEEVEILRDKYEILRSDRIPIDIFSFLEIDLQLNPIPFPNLLAKYRVEAAITADFSGVYLDEEQYVMMEVGPEWKLNRLRFTVAHELAHYFLHRDIPQPNDFSSMENFSKWTATCGGKKFDAEQEANEFAGRLLVPLAPLRACFDEFAPDAEKLVPNFMASGPLRDKFAEKIAPKFGVNQQVIAVRLHREDIWPAA